MADNLASVNHKIIALLFATHISFFDYTGAIIPNIRFKTNILCVATN